MKEELMFDGITEIREDIIERAEAYVFPGETQNGKSTKLGLIRGLKANPVWVTVTVAAACLLLVFVTPFVYMATERCGTEMAPKPGNPGDAWSGNEQPGAVNTQAPGNAETSGSNVTGKGEPGDMAPEAGVGTDDVWIYYVEDGEICREQHLVKLQPASIFELWKEKNGIGEEVQLLDCELRSIATTEEVGEVVIRTLGDYFALYLTVSKNLEAYYEQTDEGLLLDSLEQTMTGYSGLTYQEYHLILE